VGSYAPSSSSSAAPRSASIHDGSSSCLIATAPSVWNLAIAASSTTVAALTVSSWNRPDRNGTPVASSATRTDPPSVSRPPRTEGQLMRRRRFMVVVAAGMLAAAGSVLALTAVASGQSSEGETFGEDGTYKVPEGVTCVSIEVFGGNGGHGEAEAATGGV